MESHQIKVCQINNLILKILGIKHGGKKKKKLKLAKNEIEYDNKLI